MAHRITMIRRPTGSRGTVRRRLIAASPALLLVATLQAVAVEILPATPARPMPAPEPVATAANLPPEVVADFTRRVQPLVLNRCAAGACHGSPDSPAPRFIRPDVRGGIDRRSTQANLQALLVAVGPDRSAAQLAALLAAGHPAKPAKPRLVAAPLTPQERVNLERWLGGVQLAERRVGGDPAVRQAAATKPVAATPNRFKALLDTEANPPIFPEPEEPKGVIFPKDVAEE
ncbi:MAG: hypothetical protein ACKOCX_14065 [Planctomycetota bacterium]